VKIVATDDDGNRHDITDGVAVIYDAIVCSMDWGSGFLDVEQATEITKVGIACGFATIQEAEDQLLAYVRSVSGPCLTCGQRVFAFRRQIDGHVGLFTAEPCGHQFELYLPPKGPASLRPKTVPT